MHNTIQYIDLFEKYVFPVINYCSFIYSGTSVRNINELELILRYFTKRLFYRIKSRKTMLKVLYVDRLLLFSLKSIEHRLIVPELCLFYKVIHGLTPLSSNDTSFNSRVPGRIRLSLSHTRIYVTWKAEFYRMSTFYKQIKSPYKTTSHIKSRRSIKMI